MDVEYRKYACGLPRTAYLCRMDSEKQAEKSASRIEKATAPASTNTLKDLIAEAQHTVARVKVFGLEFGAAGPVVPFLEAICAF